MRWRADRLSSGFKRFRTILPGITLVMGIGIGVAGTRWLAPEADSTAATSKSTVSRAVASAQTNNLDKDYQRALGMVDKDLAAKRLTENQANQLRGELEAARKLLASTKPENAAEVLRTKRAEWRQWAAAHNVSNRYFMALY